jgi:alpha-aminoadipic semialdehyde synthase
MDKSKTSCLGILRELGSAWEKRTPLTPSACKELIESGNRVIVQPSRTRCFSDDEFKEVGAEVQDNLNDCNVILGINEPDYKQLVPESTYLFYSHTKKGQMSNPTLIETILEKKIRLVDYECIRGEEERRLVAFGRIAGIAGTINILKGVGELMLALQDSTPFVFTKLSYMYISVEDAKKSLTTLGGYIKEQYLPEKYTPFVIGVLGNGQVSSGVQETLKCLPHKFIKPKDLSNLTPRRDIIYVVVFNLEDIYEKKDSPFNKAEFIKSPELYTCNFESNYLKYLHVIINALYWESRYPRIISKHKLKTITSKQESKLFGIADISCDINGSIEMLKSYTEYTQPFFIYEPILETYSTQVDDSTKESIIYHAIPNLAASFSIDASNEFSNLLFKYVKILLSSTYPCKSDDTIDIPTELKNAFITSNGSLTPLYKNLFKYCEEKAKLQSLEKNKEQEKGFFVSLKMKGHLFDSGFFNIMINLFPDYNVSHKINFLSIGDNSEMSSVLYLDISSTSKDGLKNFLTIINEKLISYQLEMDIIKNNIY